MRKKKLNWTFLLMSLTCDIVNKKHPQFVMKRNCQSISDIVPKAWFFVSQCNKHFGLYSSRFNFSIISVTISSSGNAFLQLINEKSDGHSYFTKTMKNNKRNTLAKEQTLIALKNLLTSVINDQMEKLPTPMTYNQKGEW